MADALDPNDIRALMAAMESELVERKHSVSDRIGIRQNILTFADVLLCHSRPGVILVGGEEDGRSAALNGTDQFLSSLTQMKDDDNFVPLPSPSGRVQHFDGCDVAAI